MCTILQNNKNSHKLYAPFGTDAALMINLKDRFLPSNVHEV